MLLDNGVDLHSFQPTAADILKISKCDMFIYALIVAVLNLTNNMLLNYGIFRSL